MKNHLRASLLLAVAVLGSHLLFDVFPVWAGEASSGGTVRAYYFHGSFRCPTCNKMEQYAKEVIEKDFKAEADSGKLEFKSVNVERAGNEHYVQQYQLYTKALILSLQKDGREVRSQNLDEIWQRVRNKEQYKNYVRDEVAAFLKET